MKETRAKDLPSDDLPIHYFCPRCQVWYWMRNNGECKRHLLECNGEAKNIREVKDG